MNKFGFVRKFLATVLMTVMLLGVASCATAMAVAEEEAYGYWIDCVNCHATGVCSRCDGSGRQASGWRCVSCQGSGLCSSCEGEGMRELVLINGVEYAKCITCHGYGVCTHCDGSGRGEGGTLLGSYYGTKCYFCKGRGSCSTCNGVGYTRW